MPNRHMKRRSVSLIIRLMQIRTTVRYHFTRATVTVIKKSTNSKCYRERGEKETPYTVGENVSWYSH